MTSQSNRILRSDFWLEFQTSANRLKRLPGCVQSGICLSSRRSFSRLDRLKTVSRVAMSVWIANRQKSRVLASELNFWVADYSGVDCLSGS